MLNKAKLFILFLTIVTLYTGCTYRSAEREFPQQGELVTKSINVKEVQKLLQTAINTNQNAVNAKKFWFSGYIANNIQKKRNTSMFNGAFILPHGYYVSATILGVEYRFYTWDEKKYIWTEKTDWQYAEKTNIPLDPFLTFRNWVPYLSKAEELPTEKILNKDCFVYQTSFHGVDWLLEDKNNQYTSLFTTYLSGDNKEMGSVKVRTDLAKFLANSDFTLTIWLGDDKYTRKELLSLAKEKGLENESEFNNWAKANYFLWDEKNQVFHQHLIYQYKVEIKMPLPDAGYMEQEVFFRFYKYDDPGIKLSKPEEIEHYIKTT